jgi:hypothetical protein
MIDHESLALAGFLEKPFSHPRQHTKWVRSYRVAIPEPGAVCVTVFFGPGSPAAHAAFQSDARPGTSMMIDMPISPQQDHVVSILGRMMVNLDAMSDLIYAFPLDGQ